MPKVTIPQVARDIIIPLIALLLLFFGSYFILYLVKQSRAARRKRAEEAQTELQRQLQNPPLARPASALVAMGIPRVGGGEGAGAAAGSGVRGEGGEGGQPGLERALSTREQREREERRAKRNSTLGNTTTCTAGPLPPGFNN